MLWRRHLIVTILMIIWICPTSAMCPTACNCRLDDQGRRKVFCYEGGMTNPIPTDSMDHGMEVLEITAPQYNWNSLTIEPTFLKFKNLEELRVRRSTITQIGMHTFWGVPSLKVLDLNYNNISALSDHNFRGLLNLIELHLNDNTIGKLPSGVFKHLTELRLLTLERNRLEELVPRIFLKLGQLRVLKLSGNPLLELDPEVFQDIMELRVLECRSCRLKRINTQIYHLLPYLAHLDLGNNRIQFIDAEEFVDLRRIRSLRFDGNLLPVVLEKTFVNQAELRTLCLARNRLAKITNTAFLNLSNLYELDISYNKLDRLESAVFHPVAESLRKLALSGNHFSDDVLRVVLQTAIKLSELAIADMGISGLPSGLSYDHLRALNLSGNNLTSITVKSLPQQLVELDISRNKFRGLSERVVLRLQQLQRLKLEDNPWTCDKCNIKPILIRADNTSALIHNLTCAFPTKLRGRLINTLSLEEIKTCGESDENRRKEFSLFQDDRLILIIGGTCLLLFLIFCVVFVVCSCLRRRANNAEKEEKRIAERVAMFENPSAIFGDKGEISFKFPLDLTERKVSVSTIDEIKKDTQLHTLPNGTGI